MSLQHTLEQLIRFKTISGDHEATRDAFEWIKDQLQPVPLYMREHTHNGFPSLVMTTRRTKSPKLWLAAHVDVVHGSDTMFHPWVEKGKLYGRGAFDMKFAIACYIELLKELDIHAREYDIGIMLTSDEEIGSVNGTKALLEKDGYTGDAAFLPDGGGWWQLEECAKGVSIVEVTAQGDSAHGSRPWRGDCAIQRLQEYLSDVRAYFETLKKDTTKTGSEYWYPTMHVGTIQGGHSMNQIADSAVATIDIRYTSTKEYARIKKKLESLAKKHRRVTSKEIFGDREYGISKKNGEARALMRAAKQIAGREVGWTRSYGSSDARFFAKQNIPTLLMWPEAGGAHSEHEWIDLDDLAKYYEVLKKFVGQIARR